MEAAFSLRFIASIGLVHEKRFVVTHLAMSAARLLRLGKSARAESGRNALSEGVSVEVAGGVTVLTLDRPHRRNAFDGPILEAFHRALSDADGDDRVGAIVATGRGEAFSSGHDKDEFARLWPQDEAGVIYRLLSLLPCVRKPMVAAVTGPRAGFGATFQLHCVIAIASPSASLRYPFLEMASFRKPVPAALLERFVGPRRAADLLLTGRRLSANEALEAGRFNQIVASQELASTANSLARAIAKRPAEAVRSIIELLRAIRRRSTLEALQREIRALNPLMPALTARLSRSN
jgi:enoyl-CoA hydratase/carnithine racemase